MMKIEEVWIQSPPNKYTGTIYRYPFSEINSISLGEDNGEKFVDFTTKGDEQGWVRLPWDQGGKFLWELSGDRVLYIPGSPDEHQEQYPEPQKGIQNANNLGRK